MRHQNWLARGDFWRRWIRTTDLELQNSVSEDIINERCRQPTAGTGFVDATIVN